jgi:hypothetical protein
MTYPYAVGRILDHFPDRSPEDVIRQLRRTTFVSLEKKYLYFEVPKAASTQMKELLRSVENAGPIKPFADGTLHTRRDMFIHGRPNVPLPSLLDLDDRTQRRVLEAPDFLRMTVVRNPYTRLISAWTNKILLCEPGVQGVYLQIKGRLPDLHEKSLVSFPEFVDYVRLRCDLSTCNNHWRRQVAHTFFPAMNFSLVGKVEQLADALQQFERHLGYANSLVAEGRNKSIPSGPGLYTRDLADKVYSAYKADFEVFGYDVDSWAPVGERASQEPTKAYVSEERFRDEVIERNLIIFSLYEERDRLQTQLRWASRLRLLSALNTLVSLESISRRGVKKIKRWTRRVLHPRGQLDR